MNGIHWSENLFPALDFETTGVDPLEARAASVAALLVAPDNKIVYDFSRIVNPGIEIPAEAAEIHGLTTEKVQAEGHDSYETFLRLHRWVRSAAILGLPLVIYNAAYDWPLLLAELRRHEIEIDPVIYTIRLLDPLVIDRAVDRYRKGKRKLHMVCEAYGVVLDDAHDSRADALAAALVMRAICRKYPNVSKLSLEELQIFQGRWHREWVDRMNAYFTDNQIEMSIPQVPWPGVAADG